MLFMIDEKIGEVIFSQNDYEIESNPLSYNSRSYVRDFNCGGFALQFISWYKPETWDKVGYYLDFEEDVDDVLWACANDIERDFNKVNEGIEELNQIVHYSDAPVGVEVVGFRLAYGDYTGDEDFEIELDDFHFIWRDANGQWWDKPGSEDVREYNNDPEDIWDNRYNSKIAWFAKIAV